MGVCSEVEFCSGVACFSAADAAARASFYDAEHAFHRFTTVVDAGLVVRLHLAPVEAAADAAATRDDAGHPAVMAGFVDSFAVVAFVRDELPDWCLAPVEHAVHVAEVVRGFDAGEACEDASRSRVDERAPLYRDGGCSPIDAARVVRAPLGLRETGAIDCGNEYLSRAGREREETLPLPRRQARQPFRDRTVTSARRSPGLAASLLRAGNPIVVLLQTSTTARC